MKPKVPNADCWAQRDAYPWSEQDELREAVGDAAVAGLAVEPKNVIFPTDARLLNRARESLVRLAQRHGVGLRQSYARVGKITAFDTWRTATAA